MEQNIADCTVMMGEHPVWCGFQLQEVKLFPMSARIGKPLHQKAAN